MIAESEDFSPAVHFSRKKEAFLQASELRVGQNYFVV